MQEYITMTIKQINKQLDKIQKELITHLSHTNIEYVDLLAYHQKVQNLKTKKDYVYLQEL